MRKVLSVIFLSLSGLQFFIVNVLAFLSGLPLVGKLSSLAIFTGAALVPHLIGLAFGGFRYWKRDTGMVLLSVAGVTAFMMLSIVCLFKSEEFVRLTGENAFNAFSSFYTGGALLALNAGLGWLLVKTGPTRVAIE